MAEQPIRERLLELAARCEQATGPDRELDADGVIRGIRPTTGDRQQVMSFTRSLDAAMSVVPDGALWKVDCGVVWSDDQGPDGQKRDYRTGVGMGDMPAQWVEGRSYVSPALALVAASLRARATSPTKEKDAQ